MGSIMVLALFVWGNTKTQAAPADQPVALQQAASIEVTVNTSTVDLPAGLTSSGSVDITAQLKASGADFVPADDDPKQIYFETTFGQLSKFTIVEGFKDEVNDGKAKVSLSSMVAGEATVTVTYANADGIEVKKDVTVTFERPDGQGVYEKLFEPGTAINDWEMPGIGTVDIPADLYDIPAIVKFTNTTAHIAEVPQNTNTVGGFVMQLFWSDGGGLIFEEGVTFDPPVRLEYMADDVYSGQTDLYTALWDGESESWSPLASAGEKGKEPVVSYLTTYGDYAKLAGPGYAETAPDGIMIEADPTTVSLPDGITDAGSAEVKAYLTYDGKPWVANKSLPSRMYFETTFGKPSKYSRDIIEDGDGTNVMIDLESMVAGEAEVKATYAMQNGEEISATTKVMFERPTGQGVYEIGYTKGMSKTTETMDDFGTAEISGDLYDVDSILKFTAMSDDMITEVPTGTQALGGFVLQLFWADGFGLILEEGITFGTPITLTYTADGSEQVACLTTNGDYATLKQEDGTIYTAMWDVEQEEWVEIAPCTAGGDGPDNIVIEVASDSVDLPAGITDAGATEVTAYLTKDGAPWAVPEGVPSRMYFETTFGKPSKYSRDIIEDGDGTNVTIDLEAMVAGEAEVKATYAMEGGDEISASANVTFVRPTGQGVYEIGFTKDMATKTETLGDFGTAEVAGDVYGEDAILKLTTNIPTTNITDTPEGTTVLNAFVLQMFFADGFGLILEEGITFGTPMKLTYTADGADFTACLTTNGDYATLKDSEGTIYAALWDVETEEWVAVEACDVPSPGPGETVLDSVEMLEDDAGTQKPRVSTRIPAGACSGTINQTVTTTPTVALNAPFVTGFILSGDCGVQASKSITSTVRFINTELISANLTLDGVGIRFLKNGAWSSLNACPSTGNKAECFDAPSATLSATINELTFYTQNITEFAVSSAGGDSVYLPLVMR